MKYLKMLGLLAVAAVAAMAIAATASATELTSPEGKVYTGEIVAEAQGGGIVTHNAAETFTCQKSIAKGTIEAHGSSVTASGKVTSWNLSECNTDLVVLKTGSIEIHTETESSNGNATVTTSGMEIETKNTGLGMTCIYSTNATDIGVLTGSNTKNATIAVSTAKVPRTGGSALCGSAGTLTGEYKITTPSTLYAH